MMLDSPSFSNLYNRIFILRDHKGKYAALGTKLLIDEKLFQLLNLLNFPRFIIYCETKDVMSSCWNAE